MHGGLLSHLKWDCLKTNFKVLAETKRRSVKGFKRKISLKLLSTGKAELPLFAQQSRRPGRWVIGAPELRNGGLKGYFHSLT